MLVARLNNWRFSSPWKEHTFVTCSLKWSCPVMKATTCFYTFCCQENVTLSRPIGYMCSQLLSSWYHISVWVPQDHFSLFLARISAFSSFSNLGTWLVFDFFKRLYTNWDRWAKEYVVCTQFDVWNHSDAKKKSIFYQWREFDICLCFVI